MYFFEAYAYFGAMDIPPKDYALSAAYLVEGESYGRYMYITTCIIATPQNHPESMWKEIGIIRKATKEEYNERVPEENKIQ